MIFNNTDADIYVQRPNEKNSYSPIPNGKTFIVDNGTLIVFGENEQQPLAAFAPGQWCEVFHDEAMIIEHDE